MPYCTNRSVSSATTCPLPAASETGPWQTLMPMCTEQAKDVAVIPQFFFPGGPPVPEAVQRGMQAKLDSCFSSSPDGLTIPAVKDLMREVSIQLGSHDVIACATWFLSWTVMVSMLTWDNQVFQLPSALAYPLFYKLAQPGASTVSLHAVQSWIMQRNVMQVCQAMFSYRITQLQCTCRLFAGQC